MRQQCRRCERPAFLPDEDDDVLELLAAGPYLRAVIAPACAADDTKCSPEHQQASDAARAYRELTDELGATYRPAVGLAQLVGWADMVPSPIQMSLAEPAQGVIQWPLGEAGAAVSLVAGDALLEATDYANVGRVVPVAMSRSYRSGTVGFGPLGAAGWHSPLLAHLRRNPVTGEVRYADGAGNVWRFLPIDHGCREEEGFEESTSGRYCVPIGLPVDLEYRGLGKGWRMVDRYGAASSFDEEGRLVAISDRHRLGAHADERGSTVHLRYDGTGQLVTIEDDLGQSYQLEYYDDPRPEAEGGDGPRYGLLRSFTDFADRSVEYRYTEGRVLEQVLLPEVGNSSTGYGGYSYKGPDRPTLIYRYNDAAGGSPVADATTAILHGELAQLRLEGYIQPAFGPSNDVLRLRLGYDATTGRVAELGVPTPGNTNDAFGSVSWSLAYPAEQAHAGPASQVVVTAPWGQRTRYDLQMSGHRIVAN